MTDETIDTLTLITPDDMHLHLRSGPMLRAVLPFTAQHFARALIMPNRPWIGDAHALLAYRDEIRRAAEVAGYPGFVPLMTLALEDATTSKMIEAARRAGAVAAKLYPLGATTGPESGGARGVAEPLSEKMREVYRAMADAGLVLCVHAETPLITRISREADYLVVVRRIVAAHPHLKVVIEHISDKDTVEFLADASSILAATITAHHLVDTIDDALESPHHLCNPVPKFDEDCGALWELIEAEHPRVFLGSDSAPHPVSAKHCARPACGVFSAPGLLPRLAQMFESRGLLHRLEGFVAQHGADFYGLPRNEGSVTLVKREMEVPPWIALEREANASWSGPLWLPPARVAIWRGGETLAWSVAEPETQGMADP